MTTFQQTLSRYYSLTKPGVLYGNVMTAGAGFLFASRHTFDWWLFIITMLGTSLVIGAACTINNVLDRDIDRIMARTKKRATVTGAISAKNATIFGIAIGVAGIISLALWTNWLVVIIGIVGFIDYVWLYGAFSKRHSMHGTLVGSISGATPILAGYCAVAGQIDITAMLLFAALFFWQMPEFYSISVYRQGEYKAAGVPVISVVKGIAVTKKYIFAYTLAFVAATLLLPLGTSVSTSYMVSMTVLGAYWLWLGFVGLKTQATDDATWAKKMFRFSLVVILAFSALLSVDRFLP
ncbi:MAG TPA: heme o synthase [Candidatus Saccharimonadales bacterium]|nr:heme o synthase [Candidatus Saccharimonadales bacterium]